MKWIYSVKNKMMASLALFILCLLVLMSNYIDRNHTNNVKKAISTLYEDRLIAEGYILKITNNVFRIKETLISDVSDRTKNETIEGFFSIIEETEKAYLRTQFTDAEKVKTDELLRILPKLKQGVGDTGNSLHLADEAIVMLNELSAIQLAESKQIMSHAETLYLSGKASSQFVTVLIIVILIVLQALVFASKVVVPRNLTKSPHLN